MLQFVPISSCPVTKHHWEESVCVIFTPTHQLFSHIDKIPPHPSFLQAKQSHLPHPSYDAPIHSSSQWHYTDCFMMSMSLLSDYTYSRCALNGAELWGIITSLLQVALFLTQPRTALTFFATRAHCWLILTRCPWSPGPFQQSCFPFICTQLVQVHGVIPPMTLHSPVLNLMGFLCPVLQPVEVSPNGIIWVMNEKTKQCWTEYWPLGTSLLTGLQLDLVQLITTLWTRSFVPFSFLLTVYLCSPYFINLSLKVLWEVVMKVLLKLRKIRLNMFLIHWAKCFTIESCQVGQTWLPLFKSLLTTPEHLLVLKWFKMITRIIFSIMFPIIKVRLDPLPWLSWR